MLIPTRAWVISQLQGARLMQLSVPIACYNNQGQFLVLVDTMLCQVLSRNTSCVICAGKYVQINLTAPTGEYLNAALNDFDPDQYNNSIVAISDGANKLLILVLRKKYPQFSQLHNGIFMQHVFSLMKYAFRFIKTIFMSLYNESEDEFTFYMGWSSWNFHSQGGLFLYIQHNQAGFQVCVGIHSSWSMFC